MLTWTLVTEDPDFIILTLSTSLYPVEADQTLGPKVTFHIYISCFIPRFSGSHGSTLNSLHVRHVTRSYQRIQMHDGLVIPGGVGSVGVDPGCPIHARRGTTAGSGGRGWGNRDKGRWSQLFAADQLEPQANGLPPLQRNDPKSC